jgi:putative hemolysin
MSQDTEAAVQFAEIRSGNLGVRIAAGSAEIDAVQALRYKVFYQEMGANPDAATMATQRDRDIYDTVADHLLVVDHGLGEGGESVVGTYRLIQREAAQRIGHFYSSDEYDIAGPALITAIAIGR